MRLAAILFCASVASAVQGQPATTPTEEGYWENTSIKAGLNTYNGDADTTALVIHADWNAGLGLLLESDFDFDSSFHTSHGTDFIDQQKVDWALRRKFRPRSEWFAMLHTWAEHHESKGIDRRVEIGPGIGIHLLDNKKTRVTLEGGVALAREELNDGLDQNYTALFLDTNWDWVINEQTKLDHDTKFRLNTDDTGDLRVYSETDLSYQLGKSVFALTVGVVLSYDAHPARGHEEMNVETHTMLKVTFAGKSK